VNQPFGSRFQGEVRASEGQASARVEPLDDRRPVWRAAAPRRGASDGKRAAAAILDKQTFYRDVAATYEGIKPIDLVPNLSPQNLVSVEIGKDFMLSHKYIKNDFDVKAWAAPEFLERAAKELLEQQWKKVTTAKLPEATELLGSGQRIG
jgi:hypothetical protein